VSNPNMDKAVPCIKLWGTAVLFTVEAAEKKFVNFFSAPRRFTPQKAAKRLLRKNS